MTVCPVRPRPTLAAGIVHGLCWHATWTRWQTIERQAETIAEWREDRGRQAAELKRAESIAAKLSDELEAVARTAPLADIVYDLILIWYAARVQQGRAAGWLARPWYRSKPTPSFLDMLTAVRQESWHLAFPDPPRLSPFAQNPPALGHQALQATA